MSMVRGWFFEPAGWRFPKTPAFFRNYFGTLRDRAAAERSCHCEERSSDEAISPGLWMYCFRADVEPRPSQ